MPERGVDRPHTPASANTTMPSSAHRLVALALAAALCALSAAAQEIDFEINLGDSVNGQIVNSVDVDTVRFQGLVGTKVTFNVKGKKGFKPTIELLDAMTQETVDTSAFEKAPGKSSVAIKKFILPDTKEYDVRIGSFDGEGGEYKASFKGKISKDLKKKKVDTIVAGGATLEVPFLGDAGALLTAKVKPSKKSQAVPAVLDIDTPSGTIDPSPLLKIKKTTTTLKKQPLTELGEHVFNVQNTDSAGGIKVTLKIKFPKIKKTKYVEDTSPGSIEGDVTVQDIAVQPEIEPNDSFGSEQVLGGLAVGGTIRVDGEVAGDTEFNFDFDAYQVEFSGPQTVQVVLLHDATPAGVVDLDISIENGVTFEQIGGFATTSVPEVGLIDIDQGAGETVLLNLVVFSNFEAALPGPYILELTSVPLGAGAAATATQAAATVAGARSPGLGEPVAVPAATVALRSTVEAGPVPQLARPNPLDVPAMDGEFIVMLKDQGRNPADWAAERGLSVAMRSGGGHFLVRAPDVLALGTPAARRAATQSTIRDVQRDPEVLYAEPNAILKPMREPNDTYYGLQWHYGSMGLPAAWDVTTGSSDIIVAVLDTGIFNHPDLAARDSGYGIDMISSPSISLDGDGIDTNPTDAGDQINSDGSSSWHGTHVAGTVGAISDNGSGVAGVDWACRLMHVRVLGKGGGTTFDIYEGVRYAARLQNASGLLPAERADVLNMSLGGFGFSQTAQNAVTAAFNAGCVVVAAAGNENTSQLAYPASYDNVISVSAMGFDKQRAPYSNFGSAIDVAAPGGNLAVDQNGDLYGDGVASTIVDDSNPFNLLPAYSFNQGTSMACPHVAGLCALMLSVNPGLTPSQVESLLKGSADDLGAPGRDDIYGEGFVNALAAVQAAAGGAGVDPILSASPLNLNFGTSLTQLAIGVTNAGGGTLNVNFSTSEISGPPAGGSGWLSAAANGSNVVVSVNRAAVAVNGVYTGQVSLTSNAGDVTIPVTMSKVSGSSATLDVGTVFVLAVDVDDLSTVAQDTITQASPSYSLQNVPVGAWLLAAGPDLDDDGFICGLGEPCGLYPVFSEPVLVGLDASEIADAIDFSVTDAALLPAAFGTGPAPFLPVQGLRLMTPND